MTVSPPPRDLGAALAEAEAAEQLVLDHLQRLGVRYDEVRIDPAHADTATFCATYGFEEEASGNCIVVRTKTGPLRHAACVVQATRRLDVNRTVKAYLDARKVSFAPPEETVALTGMLAGGVTPFGLPDDLPVLLDPPLLTLDRVIVGGGSRSLKLLVPPSALTAVASAEVIEGLSR